MVVTDPEAVANAQRLWGDLTYTTSTEEALRGADVVLLLTEWPQYVGLDPAHVASLVRGKQVIDGRNVLDAAGWRAAGFTYRALGRPGA